jgi:predicted nucleic-acid-binding Zn-ribbon protein
MNLTVQQIAKQEVLCPRCKTRKYTPYYNAEYVPGLSMPFPSLSRRDNKTYICHKCGEREAFEDVGFGTIYEGEKYWEEDK